MLKSEDIKRARERIGESQSEFAARFGVDQGTISRWERRGIPRHGAALNAIESVLKSLETSEAA